MNRDLEGSTSYVLPCILRSYDCALRRFPEARIRLVAVCKGQQIPVKPVLDEFFAAPYPDTLEQATSTTC